jgi:putative ABC transport system ATP-binding protein
MNNAIRSHDVPHRVDTSLAVLTGVTHTIAEGNSSRTLFQNVNAQFPVGAISAILGPSGSGKSTLLSILGGLIAPTTGTITASGVDLTRLDETARCRFRREHIGFVFQDIRLLPQLNALDNVLYPAWFRYRDAAVAKRAADEALNAVGMMPQATAMPAAMSGGEKQRVALARVLACDPPLILADEPTAALDWASAETFLNLLRERVPESNKAAVLVTHDPRVIAWVQHIYHLENGGLRYESN